MADDIAWALAYLEEDAEVCSAVNGERDPATKEARRLETVFKRMVREREEAAARIAELERTLGALCWLSWPRMIAGFSPRTRELIMARVEHGRSLVARRALTTGDKTDEQA